MSRLEEIRERRAKIKTAYDNRGESAFALEYADLVDELPADVDYLLELVDTGARVAKFSLMLYSPTHRFVAEEFLNEVGRQELPKTGEKKDA